MDGFSRPESAGAERAKRPANNSNSVTLLQRREDFHLLYGIAIAVVAITVLASKCACQVPTPGGATQQPGQTASGEDKHVLWIIPNYRTSPDLKNYEPLTIREKFKVAEEDSLDRGTIALGAIFAGQGLLSNSNKSFGHGVEGYAQYFGASYAGLVIGNYMTEGIFPALLHQDPRYFRRGTGSGWSRLGYSMGQIFWTHTDSGGTQFNYSEIVGNSTAVAISTAYYKNGRDASDAVSSLGLQVGVDMASNVLKEFWPDIERKFVRKHKNSN
jgi:hypothetical protein